MKVIDLLVKIANGEEVPKEIIGKNSLGQKEKYIYNDFWYIHIFENPDGEEDYYYMGRNIHNLNDEVEIIEEEPRDIEVCGSWFTKSEYDKLAHSEEDKKIEPIEWNTDDDNCQIYFNGAMNYVSRAELELAIKINEIIDYLHSKGDE